MGMPIKIRMLLWIVNNLKKYDIKELTHQEFRKFADGQGDQLGTLIDGKPIPLRKIENRTIPGRGGDIPLRMYFPEQKEDVPVIVYFHGGGFVIGNLDTHDKVCRRICRDNKAIVVAVDYRLAPENKFPAAVHDSYDATVWVSKNIASYGGDSSRLVVMGDSAGGNLATVVSMIAKEKNGPSIAFQVLVYPVVDAHLATRSIKDLAKGYILTEELMHWFTDHYKRTVEDIEDPYMSPLLAKDHSGLPPALIQIAEYDPLRDDGKDYAKRLKESGVEVTLTDYEGLVHTYFTMPEISKKCLAPFQEIQQVLQSVFSKKKAVTG